MIVDNLEITPEVVRLIHLAYIKNELNKRRRRFYHLIDDPCKEWAKIGEEGYERMKKEIKKLTPEIRKLRKLTSCHIWWGVSGNILRIGKEIRKIYPVYGIVYYDWHDGGVVEAKNFKKFHDMYLVDNILLKEQNLIEIDDEA